MLMACGCTHACNGAPPKLQHAWTVANTRHVAASYSLIWNTWDFDRRSHLLLPLLSCWPSICARRTIPATQTITALSDFHRVKRGTTAAASATHCSNIYCLLCAGRAATAHHLTLFTVLCNPGPKLCITVHRSFHRAGPFTSFPLLCDGWGPPGRGGGGLCAVHVCWLLCS